MEDVCAEAKLVFQISTNCKVIKKGSTTSPCRYYVTINTEKYELYRPSRNIFGFSLNNGYPVVIHDFFLYCGATRILFTMEAYDRTNRKNIVIAQNEVILSQLLNILCKLPYNNNSSVYAMKYKVLLEKKSETRSDMKRLMHDIFGEKGGNSLCYGICINVCYASLKSLSPYLPSEILTESRDNSGNNSDSYASNDDNAHPVVRSNDSSGLWSHIPTSAAVKMKISPSTCLHDVSGVDFRRTDEDNGHSDHLPEGLIISLTQSILKEYSRCDMLTAAMSTRCTLSCLGVSMGDTDDIFPIIEPKWSLTPFEVAIYGGNRSICLLFLQYCGHLCFPSLPHCLPPSFIDRIISPRTTPSDVPNMSHYPPNHPDVVVLCSTSPLHVAVRSLRYELLHLILSFLYRYGHMVVQRLVRVSEEEGMSNISTAYDIQTHIEEYDQEGLEDLLHDEDYLAFLESIGEGGAVEGLGLEGRDGIGGGLAGRRNRQRQRQRQRQGGRQMNKALVGYYVNFVDDALETPLMSACKISADISHRCTAAVPMDEVHMPPHVSLARHDVNRKALDIIKLLYQHGAKLDISPTVAHTSSSSSTVATVGNSYHYRSVVDCDEEEEEVGIGTGTGHVGNHNHNHGIRNSKNEIKPANLTCLMLAIQHNNLSLVKWLLGQTYTAVEMKEMHFVHPPVHSNRLPPHPPVSQSSPTCLTRLLQLVRGDTSSHSRDLSHGSGGHDVQEVHDNDNDHEIQQQQQQQEQPHRQTMAEYRLQVVEFYREHRAVEQVRKVSRRVIDDWNTNQWLRVDDDALGSGGVLDKQHWLKWCNPFNWCVCSDNDELISGRRKRCGCRKGRPSTLLNLHLLKCLPFATCDVELTLTKLPTHGIDKILQCDTLMVAILFKRLHMVQLLLPFIRVGRCSNVHCLHCSVDDICIDLAASSSEHDGDVLSDVPISPTSPSTSNNNLLVVCPHRHVTTHGYNILHVAVFAGDVSICRYLCKLYVVGYGRYLKCQTQQRISSQWNEFHQQQQDATVGYSGNSDSSWCTWKSSGDGNLFTSRHFIGSGETPLEMARRMLSALKTTQQPSYQQPNQQQEEYEKKEKGIDVSVDAMSGVVAVLQSSMEHLDMLRHALMAETVRCEEEMSKKRDDVLRMAHKTGSSVSVDNNNTGNSNSSSHSVVGSSNLWLKVAQLTSLSRFGLSRGSVNKLHKGSSPSSIAAGMSAVPIPTSEEHPPDIAGTGVGNSGIETGSTDGMVWVASDAPQTHIHEKEEGQGVTEKEVEDVYDECDYSLSLAYRRNSIEEYYVQSRLQHHI